MEFGRKRRVGGNFGSNSGIKKSRNESESFMTGVGSKSKPCMKFFSTSGCSYGEGCHFLHYVPGYTAMSQLSNMGSNPAPPFGRNGASFSDGPAPTVKSKFCSRFNTAEGCRFGDKCHFAHSEVEVGKQVRPGYNDFQTKGPLSGFSPMVRGPGGPFKTKMCANFSKGLCTFGEKCHFAHGLNELQKPLA
ncbi:zinc finger CCCH domain-containing protein 14 [Capsicum chacoense]